MVAAIHTFGPLGTWYIPFPGTRSTEILTTLLGYTSVIIAIRAPAASGHFRHSSSRLNLRDVTTAVVPERVVDLASLIVSRAPRTSTTRSFLTCTRTVPHPFLCDPVPGCVAVFIQTLRVNGIPSILLDMNLVYTEDFGIKGINYYWVRNEMYGISRGELLAVGVSDERCQVDLELIPILQKVNSQLKEQGYELLIKDGYRSPKLYALIYKKRVEKFGEEETARILNVIDMPHANGRTVDVTLLDIHSKEEVTMRDKRDGTDAFFVDYYRDKKDPASQQYHRVQTILSRAMRENGFIYGSKMEFWHFTLPA